jgi:HYR domain
MSRAAVAVTLALLALSGAAGTSSAAPTRQPELTVPADITAEAEAPTGAGVSFTASAVGRENRSLPVTCSPVSGSTFPLGHTTVTCTAQDRPDEVATKTFRVTVADRTPPQLIVPATLSVRTTNRKGAVARFRASATDLVDGQLAPDCSPRSGALFRVGATTVECTATDRRQNVARASFTVVISFSRQARRARQAALYSPVAGAVVGAPPLLRWRAVPRATYYNIQVYRGGHRILSFWPSRPRFQLHDSWNYHGRRMILTSGSYAWLVWPGFGDLARANYGRLLGRSTFRVQ